MTQFEAIIFSFIIIINLGINRAVIHLRSHDTVLNRWRENWTYTISKMDSKSAEFYTSNSCQIAEKRHIREHIDDAFSTWVNVFVKCRGMEEGLISVAVCDPYCRNGLRACEVIRHMDNVPVFRREQIKDRNGRTNNVQVPVACRCKLRDSFKRSEICLLSARIGLTFRRDS